MPDSIRIAAICGSLRKGSYNAMALEAARDAAPEGVVVEIIRLHDVELYDADVEAEGWPPGVSRLRERVEPAQAVLFGTPEYNYSIPGVLKNAIDWLSRPTGEGPLYGKPAAMIGASTSLTGTARAQSHMRNVCFYNAMPLLASSEVLIYRASERFEGGELVDDKSLEKVAELMAGFVDLIRRYPTS
jgi:chromate reductase, NAD(P)H dehydrogenase (quinone)